MNAIYLSTGAFIGRVNGRDPRLLQRYHSAFECDGFELMIYEDFYPALDDILSLFRGIAIPVIHSDKAIGDCLSADGDEAFDEAKRLLRINLAACEAVGAQKMVFHGWGKPSGDKNPERTAERALAMWSEARARGVDLLCENCVCVSKDPLEMFDRMLAREERLHFIFDTRPAQFHAQLARTLKSEAFVKHAVHMHINDFAGGYRQWDALYPIPQPGSGNIDWTAFFDGLRAAGYAGSLTLEAPSMRPEGVDAVTLNRGLHFIRDHLLI